MSVLEAELRVEHVIDDEVARRRVYPMSRLRVERLTEEGGVVCAWSLQRNQIFGISSAENYLELERHYKAQLASMLFHCR